MCAYIHALHYRSVDEQGQVHLDNVEAQSCAKSTKHLHCELAVHPYGIRCVYVICLSPLLFVEKGKRESQRGKAIN